MNTAVALAANDTRVVDRKGSGSRPDPEVLNLPPGFDAALDDLLSESESAEIGEEHRAPDAAVDAPIQHVVAPHFLLAAHFEQSSDRPVHRDGSTPVRARHGEHGLSNQKAKPQEIDGRLNLNSPEVHASSPRQLEHAQLPAVPDGDGSQPAHGKAGDMDPGRGKDVLSGADPEFAGIRITQSDVSDDSQVDADTDAILPPLPDATPKDTQGSFGVTTVMSANLTHGTAPAIQIAERLVTFTGQAHGIMRILQQSGDPGPVVRNLQFGLSPRELGNVRVTLEIASDRLDIRIETQHEDAARRLELDRDLLDQMLVQAGFAPDRSQVDIRVVKGDVLLSSSPDTPGQSGDGAASFHEQGRAGDDARRRQEGSTTHAPRDHTSGSKASVVPGAGERRGGIYL